MKILCYLNNGFGLYNIRSKDDEGYVAISTRGNLFYMKKETIIGEFSYDTKLEVLKQTNPEYFL